MRIEEISKALGEAFPVPAWVIQRSLRLGHGDTKLGVGFVRLDFEIVGEINYEVNMAFYGGRIPKKQLHVRASYGKKSLNFLIYSWEYKLNDVTKVRVWADVISESTLQRCTYRQMYSWSTWSWTG
ncbi:hypothetical protein HN958_01735 [Candidatus Falkowbacteria bacterium]|nr:hypothetical protein [Candidatus Falkowbacteria bacterium]MBT7007206.1 hypothetical protein [Candidatus Falkowbacteria bacterium]